MSGFQPVKKMFVLSRYLVSFRKILYQRSTKVSPRGNQLQTNFSVIMCKLVLNSFAMHCFNQKVIDIDIGKKLLFFVTNSKEGGTKVPKSVTYYYINGSFFQKRNLK
jgi:hypothetical protein